MMDMQSRQPLIQHGSCSICNQLYQHLRTRTCCATYVAVPMSFVRSPRTRTGAKTPTWLESFQISTMWYNSNSIANILSLADLCKVCTVTMDLSLSLFMDVHPKDDLIMSFLYHPAWAFSFIRVINVASGRVPAYTLLTTVADHLRMFSQQQIQQADRARKLRSMRVRPDEIFFQLILKTLF